MNKRLFFIFMILYSGLTWANDHSQVHSDPVTYVLLGILAILVAARISGKIFESMGFSSVLGEILIGIILGNLYLLGVDWFEFLKVDYGKNFQPQDIKQYAGVAIDLMGRLGVILLLFMIGLKTSIREMIDVGWISLGVAVVGIILPMSLGWGFGYLFFPASSWYTHLFIGTTLTATSVAITARTLSDLDKVKTTEAKIILGASVIDDVLGLLLLTIVQGLVFSVGQEGSWVSGILWIILKAAVFIIGALLFGQAISRYLLVVADFLHDKGLLLLSGLTFCFVLSLLADYAGLATIVGAFAAGLILDKRAYEIYSHDHHERKLHTLLTPLREMFVPIFFVLIGIHVELRNLANVEVVFLAFILTIIAVIGKMSCSLVVMGRNINKMSIGLGMIPRGEVTLIFATIGHEIKVLDQPVISSEIYTSIIIMVFVTTIITPVFLKWMWK